MKITVLLLIVALLSGLAGCSGDKARSCDDVQRYQLAAEGQRIETPNDLDDLEPLREMPLPQASPRPPRPEGSPCIDLPPSVLSGQQ